MARSKQPARRSFKDIVAQGEARDREQRIAAADASESITLLPQQFSRWQEVVEYAVDRTGGDLGAAIIELVNTSLSYRSGRWSQ